MPIYGEEMREKLLGIKGAVNATLYHQREWIDSLYYGNHHLSGCSALQRNYVEIDKKDAVERGYTPCSKCGG